MKYTIYFTFLLLHLTSTLIAQRKFEIGVREMAIESLNRFKTFLSLPNDASKGDEILENISWTDRELRTYGFEIKLLETSSLPLMIANLNIKKELPTLAIYMHLDGQAVDLSKWSQPDPYEAVIKEETSNGFKIISWDAIERKDIEDLRLFARSSSDDKGPFAMFLTA